ncbi:MAG: chromophore lyase CpcT/CpeT [Leptolyngbya sp.]|nr:chromophore lyase CpcT/CpeT [Leptolyngbya sp.]
MLNLTPTPSVFDARPAMPILPHLAAALAGEFDNQAQSLAEPIWYLHLRLWNRPLSPAVFGEGYSFFIEQISVASGAPPYRQRILHLTQRGDYFWGQYYGLACPGDWQGSGTQPERLARLTRADLVELPTCGLAITWDKAQYCARMPADSLCEIAYQGQTSYIALGFDLAVAGSSVDLKVYDHGVDPSTGKTTWGPAMGPFHLQRRVSYDLA